MNDHPVPYSPFDLPADIGDGPFASAPGGTRNGPVFASVEV